MSKIDNYLKVWDDFGRVKSETYVGYKFLPTYRVGLTNYLRERKIIDFLNIEESDIVLDVGCAAGRQLLEVSMSIKKGHGTDIAQSFVDKANVIIKEKKINNLHFQQAEIEKLPFEDSHFDKIICAEVLEHVFDKNVAINELIRTLKKDGILVITVPNYNADGTLWGRLLRMLGFRKFQPLQDFSKEDLIRHGDAHVREFDRRKMTQWLESKGLNVVKIQSVSFIDGPCFDFLLKFPLHIVFLKRLIIEIEKKLSNLNIFYGRHLVVGAKKQ